MARQQHIVNTTFPGVDAGDQADLTLSLEVILLLVEDAVFKRHLEHLFDASRYLVAIFSSNTDVSSPKRPPHFLHRRFSTWVTDNRPDFELVDVIPFHQPDTIEPVTSVSDFYIYVRHQPLGEEG